MWNKGFEGWYFKHQKDDDMLAFIPGRAESGAFIQIISSAGARQYSVPKLSVDGTTICSGSCVFSLDGCMIDLPNIKGKILYNKIQKLCSDIMGPFRYMPMECRHGVISMSHELNGYIDIDGKRHNFDGGLGYIEKDSGNSFPKSYQWLQCNDFSEPCSIMVSIAHIPFMSFSFTGCICAIIYRGCEYRLATYNGVHILSADENHICLSQGDLKLDIDIIPLCKGHPLRSPLNGKMSCTVHECTSAKIYARFSDKEKPVFNLKNFNAAYEYVSARSK